MIPIFCVLFQEAVARKEGQCTSWASARRHTSATIYASARVSESLNEKNDASADEEDVVGNKFLPLASAPTRIICCCPLLSIV